SQLSGELHRVAVPPLGPESALAAIVAQVWAAARELRDDGAPAAPVGIVLVVDQFPADAIVVEVADHLCGRGTHHGTISSKRDSADGPGVRAARQSLNQQQCRSLAFPSHDDVNVAAIAQDLVPGIGRVYPAVHDDEVGHGPLEQTAKLDDGGMSRAGAGV